MRSLSLSHTLSHARYSAFLSGEETLWFKGTFDPQSLCREVALHTKRLYRKREEKSKINSSL